MTSTGLSQQLRRLDRSSPRFQDQLSNILFGEEFRQHASKLQSDDGLVWLVDYLDNALDVLDPASSAFRKCLRELRNICGTKMTLPTSYALSSLLLNIGRQPVASGGSGDIYEGTFKGSRVCVKRVRVYSKDGPNKATKILYQEAVVWKRLAHPNIVPLLGITPTPLQLVSEWMPGGDLTEYIKSHPDTDRLGLLCDIANGLHYLHSHNIVHGDLKGSNILVDRAGCARITDFGLATVTQNLDSMRSVSDNEGHTARWTAPEILTEEGAYSKEADIFSFAMVMIEVFTGAVPFNNSLPAAAVLAIMSGTRPPRPTHPDFTDELWELIQHCWNQKPHTRPEVSDVLKVLGVLGPHPIKPSYMLPSAPTSTIEPPDDLGVPAWKRLVSHTLTTDRRISLITAIFSGRGEVEMDSHLSREDAQAFVDKVYKELDSLPSGVRRRCLRCLCKICGRYALLPRSLMMPHYDTTANPLHHGGNSDVWKGRYQDLEVAAKVLRVYSLSDLERTRKRFCEEVIAWGALRHPNVLPLLGVTMSENRFVIVSEWMVGGNIMEFVEVNVDADRMGFLRDVTRGLTYVHDQGIIHGDLKGANVLINNSGHACLADFTLLTIAPSQSASTVSSRTGGVGGGTIQWMSPELLNPERFGLEGGRPTKQSDCYALGMVIYEVLSGQAPFASYNDSVAIRKVLEGERPVRPQGDGGKLFTAAIWRLLELCWKPQPGDRPSVEDVLLGLEGNENRRQVSLRRRSYNRTSRNLTDPQTERSEKRRQVSPHRLSRNASQVDLSLPTERGENGRQAQLYGLSRQTSRRDLTNLPTECVENGSNTQLHRLSRRQSRQDLIPQTGHGDDVPPAPSRKYHPMPVPDPLTRPTRSKDRLPTLGNDPPQTVPLRDGKFLARPYEGAQKGGWLSTLFRGCCCY